MLAARRRFLWLSAGTAASEQTNPSPSDYAAVTQAICRQYAASQRAMPYDYDTMYAQCMYARGYRTGVLAVAQFSWLPGRVARPCDS